MYAQLYRRCDRLDIIIYLQTVLNYINMRYQGKLVNKTAPYTTAHYQLRECLNIDTICPLPEDKYGYKYVFKISTFQDCNKRKYI